MLPPRGLSPSEAALWAQVAGTVTPLEPIPDRERDSLRGGQAIAPTIAAPQARAKPRVPINGYAPPPPRSAKVRKLDHHGLDGSWDRKLATAKIAPDFTLDLHGLTLDAAHARLDQGLTLAVAQQARLVLVIAGKPRPVDAADRGSRRGAIRAKLLDWLAAGTHASRIAAVRPAHPRHGGAGAVYVVLRRAA